MEHRILLVEDDRSLADAICAQMKLWALECTCTADFRAVMAEFARVQPHLVLMDVSLPYMSGYHWCAEIRKVSSVPVIFISSASDNMNIIMAMNMGGDDFIAKPVDPAVLAAKVNAVLRRVSQDEQRPRVIRWQAIAAVLLVLTLALNLLASLTARKAGKER